jgi:cobyrinic acid a,c-diamide synthase
MLPPVVGCLLISIAGRWMRRLFGQSPTPPTTLILLSPKVRWVCSTALPRAVRTVLAHLPILFGWPVIVVLDPAGQAQTAAAIARGLSAFQTDVNVAGVILNRVASPRHEALVRDGMASAGIDVFGSIPKLADIATPERHLGLVQAEDLSSLEQLIAKAAALVSKQVDLDAIRLAARSGVLPQSSGSLRITPPGQRIALARDAAFSFIYPHLIEGWRTAGAEIMSFSPLADQVPDQNADVCWLPGGYPELHAGTLAGASTFKTAMQTFACTRPVHGECGGYMVLGETLVDAKGQSHAMLGLLGHETSFAARKLHLGYRLATLKSAIPGATAGKYLAGHEFHYATLVSCLDEALASITDANGVAVAETGSRRGTVTGTFFHQIAARE